MKITTFDTEKIRNYMENSSILQNGIDYCKSLNPGVSDDVAKQTAIRLAQQYCQQKWYNDRSGYIDSEYVAFIEFEKDVRAGRYFSVKNSGESKPFYKRGCLMAFLIYAVIMIIIGFVSSYNSGHL